MLISCAFILSSGFIIRHFILHHFLDSFPLSSYT